MRILAVMLLWTSLGLAEEPMTQKSAEALARKRWFEFELKPVKTRFHGDWVAFVQAYEKEEPKSPVHGGKDPPRTPAQERAYRVVQREFAEVAQNRQSEIRALAKKVLAALQRGDLEPLVEDCAMYSANAKNRNELTRAYLNEHKVELQEAAKLVDLNAADFAATLQYTSPSPETGMTGQVAIPFGPKADPPKQELSPERHQLELWWSGEVMPDANGPLHPSPSVNRPKSRWRFYQLVKPNSQRPGQLL